MKDLNISNHNDTHHTDIFFVIDRESNDMPAEFLISEQDEWPDEDFSLLATKALRFNTEKAE